MEKVYRRLVLDRPFLTLLLLLALGLVAVTQVGKTRLDASSDALLLQGDPDLAFFRETASHYDSNEFLVLTWRPGVPLLSEKSLGPLRALAEELGDIEGVRGVTTLLDVPLLESPPLDLLDIARADSLPTLRDPGVDRFLALRELTTSPIYRNLLASEDGDLTAVQVNLEPDTEAEQLLDERSELRQQAAQDALDAAGLARLDAVEAEYDAASARYSSNRSRLVADVREVASRYRDHAEIFVGGVPMIAADMLAFVQSDLVTFGTAIIFIMAIVLLVIFRDWRWVVAPILNCALTATLMLGLLAALDWRMSVISSNFVAVLLIITLSLSIHLVVRYRELEWREPSMSRSERAAATARLMVTPCFYTALTTIVAFSSLVVAKIQPVIDFGWMMTVGIVVGFAMTFLMVPALMAVLPEQTRGESRASEQAMTTRFAVWVAHHGSAVFGTTLLLTALTIYGITQLKVENRFIDYFKESTEIYQGMVLLDEKLGGTIPLDIVLFAPGETAPSDSESALQAPAESTGDIGFDDDFFGDDPFAESNDPFASNDSDSGPSYWFTLQGRRILDQAHDIVEAREESGKVMSLSTAFEVLDGLFGSKLGSIELALIENSMPDNVAETLVNPYFAPGVDEARISVRVMETSESLRRDSFLKTLRQTLVDELDIEPDQIRFTGLLVLYNNVLQSLFSSQILTLGAVFAAIGVMFWVLFRSLSLALLALAPNLLAAGMVLGAMGILGIPLDIMTITIAAIVVGIGVDDCIHYIHRFRTEFAKDGDYHAAMYRSHGSIGRAMYYTTLTICVGFSLLTLSNFTPSLYFGLLTMAAMIAAVAGALLLLPKLILAFRPLGPEGL
ncbi:hypothetical protein NOR51B_1386 [Luminiphilus syltensis NOR5-1B]|uniref:SSD domain-containing protein n=1 Tax=Luminiphilus syltensis NOR5-1B TaxID=565045 RepID=B8KRX5_9GAMM|nr:MMPL family transporter [Luminiphilus syltensis]EED35441.1 hypothetical protein NOR51B_1386 [Luminiphilus syltensis NOR5-1B]